MSGPPSGRSQDRPFAFISTMDGDPWGGSEELWWACALRLRQEGFRVRANLIEWKPAHEKVQALRRAGVDVALRPKTFPVVQRGLRRLLGRRQTLAAGSLERWLRRDPPRLVVLNHTLGLPPPDLTEALAANRCPFLTVTHAASDFWWPDDEQAERARAGVASALKSYFVSDANLQLIRWQYAAPLSEAAVLRNPFDASHQAVVPWPAVDSAETLALACVGRLDPNSKGQDVLLRALAAPAWRNRAWTLNLYGAGPMRKLLETMIRTLGLDDRVRLRGRASVREIWSENHALVLPSRAEGLPIVVVEAMLCGRPVLTTDIGGNAELLRDDIDGFVADAPSVKQVGEALERLWRRRGELKAMGEAAAISARVQLPSDPAGEFVKELKRLAQVENDRPEQLSGHQPQTWPHDSSPSKFSGSPVGAG